VAIAASHSRTYRSSNPAAFAICADVDAGKAAMVSNSPVWCPMLSIKQSAPSFKTPVSRSNSSDPVTLSMPRSSMGTSFAPCTRHFRNMVGGLVDVGLACPPAEGET
jgi:hypothetical protein